METIVSSVDIIITTKENTILLIKRENEPQKGIYALPGGAQKNFESFEDAVERTIEKRLGLKAKIKGNQIDIQGFPTLSISQFRSYDCGTDSRGGNTTVYSIETDISEAQFKKTIPKHIIFSNPDNLPELAFDHSKFVHDYFFYYKDYTVKSQQNIGVAVDIVIMTIKDGLLKILLTKRSKEPYKNMYSLPGGFVDPQLSLDKSAKEILKRDTNISNAYLEQLYTFGELERDKRGRTISVAYYALLDYSKINLVHSKKFDEIDWFSISDLNKMGFAFDHEKIIALAIDRIKNKIEYTNIAFQLLPEKFTLAELQEVYETILEKDIDKRNFRKKIAELDMIEELNEFKKQGRMRPAKYHRFKERTKESILKVRKWI